MRETKKTSETSRHLGGKPEETKKSWKRELVEWVVTIAAAFALAWFISTFIFQLIPVEGSSMMPTLKNGDRMLVTKFTYHIREPEVGEVVITYYPDENRKNYYVKRIVGLAGDTIAVHNGVLIRNGEAIEEDYILDGTIYYEMSEVTVPDGCVFVMGDNRNDSKDSHMVGPISESLLVGRAQCIIWPFSDIGALEIPDTEVIS